jgi:hypothetical protein
LASIIVHAYKPLQTNSMMVMSMAAARLSPDPHKGGYHHFRQVVLVAVAVALSGAAYDRNTMPDNDHGWTVSSSRDQKGCFATKEFDHPGKTTLLLGIDIDGTNRLTILNDNWSIKSRETLELDFRLTGVSFPGHFAVGIASGQKKGFAASFGSRFPALFASSQSLHVYRGRVPVEQLDLVGSGAAIANLRTCVDTQRKGLVTGKADKGRPSIPRDPFGQAFDVRKNK